jgi:cobalt-zinc-cadmium efflux system outer membrane protein
MEMNTYDLLMAKQRELDSERGYVESWRDYWIAHSQLEEAVGGNLHSTPNPPQP